MWSHVSSLCILYVLVQAGLFCCVNSSRKLHNDDDKENYIFAMGMLDFFAETLAISPEEITILMNIVSFNSTRVFVSTAVRDAGVRLLHLADKLHQLDERHLRLAIANYELR